VEKGRTTDTPYGPVVHLDLRHMGEKFISARLPFVRELCLKYENIDPVKELIPVRPVIHYMMGGVHTDNNGATPLAGLYAAGEVACVSINGANRLGSNSLPELLVFGARAGKAAALAAMEQPPPSEKVVSQARDEKLRLEQQFLHKTGGRERIATIRSEMHKAMEDGAGIYRDQTSLEKAADKLRELRERFRDISLDDHSLTFNTELVGALEQSFMLDVGAAIVESALHRTESRGAHQRTDFPGRNDGNFLAHALIFRDPDGSTRMEQSPVVITRWPPGERVYGVKSEVKEVAAR
jgi:fumarate reductase flavoprotein subunit